jgi:bacillithiol system protein YtxJ
VKPSPHLPFAYLHHPHPFCSTNLCSPYPVSRRCKGGEMRETVMGSRLNGSSMSRRFLGDIFASKGEIHSPIKKANIVEVTTPEECLALFQQSFAVIFKHSAACSMSRYVYKTVSKFCSERPSFKVHLISVLDSRSARGFIEEQTRISRRVAPSTCHPRRKDSRSRLPPSHHC